MIFKDSDGQLAAAIKQLFLQPQTAGPSATVLLELCKHPVAGQFVKTWKLEELMKELNEASKIEQMNYAAQFIDLLEHKKLIDPEERAMITAKLTN
jgi:hypothetical protein